MTHTLKTLKRALVASTMVAGAVAFAVPALANPMVGGAPMLASKNIVQNAANSKVNTTLVAAVKAAGLVDTLEGAGPFTVFAPTNAAFNKLPAGTVDTLLKPENKAKLTSILTYHVVPGKMTVNDLRQKIKEGHGRALLKTVEGSDLIAEDHGSSIELLGAKDSHATITIPNVEQSNGVIQVVNGVLLPG
jgi:Secreted and surface protein containing fasciclin-like repeats